VGFAAYPAMRKMPIMPSFGMKAMMYGCGMFCSCACLSAGCHTLQLPLKWSGRMLRSSCRTINSILSFRRIFSPNPKPKKVPAPASTVWYEGSFPTRGQHLISHRSVHDQVSRSGWVGRRQMPSDRNSSQEQNFAELRAEKAPNRPFCSSVLRRNKTSSMLRAE
jgi:hypothetical protein